MESAESNYKIGVKLFFKIKGEDFQLQKFIPIMNQWIKKGEIADHLFIDVADYSHVYAGPGIVMVGHEADIYLDNNNLEPGLLYMRKQPVAADFPNVVIEVLRQTISFWQKLSKDAKDYPVKTIENRIQILFNDRLSIPNTVKIRTEMIDKIEDTFRNHLLIDIDQIIPCTDLQERLTLDILLRSDIFTEEFEKLSKAALCD